MGVLGSLMNAILLVTAVSVVLVVLLIGADMLIPTPPLPQLDPNAYWGPGEYKEDDVTIKPFKIVISKEDVNDFETRLNLPLKLQSSLEGSLFNYGFNGETLEKIVKYWRKEYDWNKREKHLNTYPHFKTEIEGLNIHFMRAKPSVEPGKDIKIVPLLLIHGWPGSFVEFMDILPKLIVPQEGSGLIFDVICPAIPGFGFSDASSKIDFSSTEMGQVFLKLMKRLGYAQFYLQGGDFGSYIAIDMATMYKENILGVHVNRFSAETPSVTAKWILGSYLPSGLFMDAKDEHKMYPFSEKFSALMRESGYLHLQATKPDTIGHALAQSPVSLAAYILEKFSTATNVQNIQKQDGGLLERNFPISLDAMLDNICIFWFTGSITSSCRIYAENFPKAMKGRAIDLIPCTVPSGFAAFPHEIMPHPKTFLAHKFSDIVSYNDMEAGGHFAAMEQPQLLADDLHKFVNMVESRKIEAKSKEKLNEL